MNTYVKISISQSQDSTTRSPNLLRAIITVVIKWCLGEASPHQSHVIKFSAQVADRPIPLKLLKLKRIKLKQPKLILQRAKIPHGLDVYGSSKRKVKKLVFPIYILPEGLYLRRGDTR